MEDVRNVMKKEPPEIWADATIGPKIERIWRSFGQILPNSAKQLCFLFF